MDNTHVLNLDEEIDSSEATAGLHRRVLPGINVPQGRTNNTDEHPFYASPPVLPPPIPTNQPTWTAATLDPVYRAAQLAHERRAEADALQVQTVGHGTRLEPIRSYLTSEESAAAATSLTMRPMDGPHDVDAHVLQVHTADHGTRLEPIRSYLTSEESAAGAASLTLRPMNGPHDVDADGKPSGLPDDFYEEGFNSYQTEDAIPDTQQSRSVIPSHLSSTPRQPAQSLPPIKSLGSGPAENQPADDRERQSQQAPGSLQAPSVTQRARVSTNLASTTAPSERQTQHPPTQNNATSRRTGNQARRSPWDSDLRSSTSYTFSRSRYQSRQTQPTPAAPPGPPRLSRQPAQHSHTAGETEDVEMADTEDGSANDLYEVTGEGWRAVNNGPYPQRAAEQPQQGSSELPHQPEINCLLTDPRLRPLAPRFPQPEPPTPPSSNIPNSEDPSRPSPRTPHLPLQSHSSTPTQIPAPQPTTAPPLPSYALGDAKTAVQARRYIALNIIDAPCTRCVAQGQVCYRSEWGKFTKCAYCMTRARRGRQEECVLFGGEG